MALEHWGRAVLSVAEVQQIIMRPKSLASSMVWSMRIGKLTFAWLATRMALQFDDEELVRESFYVQCQWRKRGNTIPEHWTFNLIYNGNRIYALHFQPTSIHENLVGKGRPFFGQEIDGIHEHTWSDDGDGYAEPISLPEGRPDIMWKMFSKRTNTSSSEFFHPDENKPELI